MSNRIKESNITPGAVTSDKIAPGTISASNISPGTITGTQIAPATVQGSNIAPATITAPNIGPAAVGASNIAPGSITTTQISPTAGIVSGQIAPGTIANDRLANTGITINGTTIALGASGTIVAGTDWQSVKTTDFTAVAGEGYFVNTTSGAVTVTLPASPSIGDQVSIIDYGGNSATNKITLAVNGNKILGSAIDKTISTNETGIVLVYTDSTKGWVVSGAYIEGTIGLVGVPGAPTIGSATAINTTTATVSFTAPADNGDSVITSYTATSSPGGITGTLSQAGSGTITVSGLTGGTSYTFTVTATNSIGTSAASSASNSITLPSALYVTATGGTIATSGDYKIHTFTGDGSFVVSCAGNPTGSTSVDYLVIAGGGGGGACRGGGGGAGGYRESHSTPVSGCYSASPLATPTALPVSATTYPVTVGGGGTGSTLPVGCGTSGNATRGSNSVFSTITSTGGGAGSYQVAHPEGPGGSGGGGGISSPAGTGNTPPTSPAQGTNGAAGGAGGSGGGGGGATVAGTVGGPGAPSNGGAGGAGATTSINATPTARAGGGGGGSYFSTGGSGGTGGGGPGGSGCSGSGTTGTTNTGGGGGGGAAGGGPTAVGGAGGKGVVIIRYKFQ